MISVTPPIAGGVQCERPLGAPAPEASQQVYFLLVALAAFGLYWLSSLLLEARGGTRHFGADTVAYTELARGNIFARIAENYYLDRIARFHPTTVALAATWMKLLEPLTAWIAPVHLLKALFAAIGASGVWAALWAFAAVVPRRYVMLLGAIYATSLSVWYFSSIEESKIVTATLSALYIALYLHLRARRTMCGAVLLTAILLVACLNEIVAGFLVIIPAVDTLVQRGWDLRAGRWIACHALAGPIALAILEAFMRSRTSAAGTHPEGATHFSMLIYYITQNDYSAASLYAFALRWLFFTLAAPTIEADFWADPSIGYGGDFEPALANYFASPVSAGAAALFGVMLAASILRCYRTERADNMAGILLALFAYALFRGMFIMILNPLECILFSSPVILAHLLMIGMPFAASSFPAKRAVLAGFAVVLFITNAAFIIGS